MRKFSIFPAVASAALVLAGCSSNYAAEGALGGAAAGAAYGAVADKDVAKSAAIGAAAGALVAGSGCALCHAVRNVGVAVSGHGWHGGLWRVYLRQRVNVEMVFVAALLVALACSMPSSFTKSSRPGLAPCRQTRAFS